MGKMSLLVGAGVGYVLGTRAGRGQYDRMVAEAQKLWRDPRVQRAAEQAQHTADDLGRRAEEKVKESVDERSGGDPSERTTTGGTTTGELHG